MTSFLLYGATGYTGKLLAYEAVRRGLRPVLAGRNASTVATLAQELGLTWHAFGLAETAKMEQALRGVALVLHCAGPFAHTAAPMVAACLRVGCHYLDITGEIDVFEALARQDQTAQAANIMLLPGSGFDVVPSDCLALYLKTKLPTATHLLLAFQGLGPAGISHGTQATMLLNAGTGGAVRRDGIITPVPTAWKTRKIDFGQGPTLAVTIPWGDVATAYYSTGIPTIEVFIAMPRVGVWLLRVSRYANKVLASSLFQRFLHRRIPAGGPGAHQRAQSRVALYGAVTDAHGNGVAARLFGPEAYTLTVATALLLVEKVLQGNWKPGFQTPAKCYGPDLVLELPGTNLLDG